MMFKQSGNDDGQQGASHGAIQQQNGALVESPSSSSPGKSQFVKRKVALALAVTAISALSAVPYYAANQEGMMVLFQMVADGAAVLGGGEGFALGAAWCSFFINWLTAMRYLLKSAGLEKPERHSPLIESLIEKLGSPLLESLIEKPEDKKTGNRCLYILNIIGSYFLSICASLWLFLLGIRLNKGIKVEIVSGVFALTAVMVLIAQVSGEFFSFSRFQKEGGRLGALWDPKAKENYDAVMKLLLEAAALSQNENERGQLTELRCVVEKDRARWVNSVCMQRIFRVSHLGIMAGSVWLAKDVSGAMVKEMNALEDSLPEAGFYGLQDTSWIALMVVLYGSLVDTLCERLPLVGGEKDILVRADKAILLKTKSKTNCVAHLIGGLGLILASIVGAQTVMSMITYGLKTSKDPEERCFYDITFNLAFNGTESESGWPKDCTSAALAAVRTKVWTDIIEAQGVVALFNAAAAFKVAPWIMSLVAPWIMSLVAPWIMSLRNVCCQGNRGRSGVEGRLLTDSVQAAGNR